MSENAALAPFRVRSFRFQWPADLATSWAWEMETLILAWYVLVSTGSVLLLTLFASLNYIGTLLAPLFGVIGHRIGERNLLCAMRAFYATLAAALTQAGLVDALAVVGAGARIGEGAWVGASCVVGSGVSVGARSRLHPHVTLYPGSVIGERVTLHSGARIGSDGFGFVYQDGAHQKIPHVGRCVIGDDVEIGANSTVDRGSIDDTVIGAGTKLDNLVHVGHNVRIGRLCLFMAHVGISGSTHIGDGVIFADAT